MQCLSKITELVRARAHVMQPSLTRAQSLCSWPLCRKACQGWDLRFGIRLSTGQGEAGLEKGGWHTALQHRTGSLGGTDTLGLRGTRTEAVTGVEGDLPLGRTLGNLRDGRLVISCRTG